tara:strand:- start:133 stop:768 length:636 start_codon:yes stop_codon:yes gene_type:complete
VNSKNISCILFDFDGVLIDSLPVMELAWESVQKKYEIPNKFSQFKQYIGLPFNEILFKLHIDISLHHYIKEHYSKVSSSNKSLIKLNPYVKEVLTWLTNNSIDIGIVTSKDKVRTYELVEYFQLNIKTLITPELTNLGKPASEPILYAVNKLDVDLNKVVYVGDMLSDMHCAFNTKCLYLHYTNGYQKLVNQSYGGQIYSLKDIIEYVKNF